MTYEHEIRLNSIQLELLTNLVEEEIYELTDKIIKGDKTLNYHRDQMMHYFSLLKSGSQTLISWNSIIGGAYPIHVEPTRYKEWLSKKLISLFNEVKNPNKEVKFHSEAHRRNYEGVMREREKMKGRVLDFDTMVEQIRRNSKG